MEQTQTPLRSVINRGAITLLEAAIYIVIALVILTVAITQGGVV